VGTILDARREYRSLSEVVWDPGYSLCQPQTAVFPLAREGIAQTFQPVTHQRGRRPFSGDGIVVDGQLFSPLLPKALEDLPVPPRGATEEEKLAYEQEFNLRARWRMVRHAGPDRQGVTRWRCPFCAGLLRSRTFRKTMRGSRRAPMVDIAESVDRCCRGILSAAPAELPLSQTIPFGTTAWRISMGRRQVVESVNAALKGAFVDLGRGFFRVMGLTKITVLLAFSLAAFNADRVRSFIAKRAEAQALRPTRAKRRKGTWHDCIPADLSESLEARSGDPPTPG
jgi:hypothetical protein